MKPGLLTLFSILPILLLIAVGQSNAQTPQRDNLPRTASIGGRVTVGGAPAANALVVVSEVKRRVTVSSGAETVVNLTLGPEPR